jgi:pilus assembly protein CpaF
MKLSERMDRAATAQTSAPDEVLGPARRADVTADPMSLLKQRAQEALFTRLGSRLYDSSLTVTELNAFVQQELSAIMEAGRTPLTQQERANLAASVSDDVLGYGPVQQFLADPTVTEVMVNGVDAIYIERDGRIHRTEARFMSDEHLRRVIDRIVSQVGRRIDESSPMVDARLPDGSRVNAIIPPLAVSGAALTIRKFAKVPYSADDLIAFGTLTPEANELLSAAVRGRLNIIVSGGTGTGKTTLLNVLSSHIPVEDRIVTIEDAVELQLLQDHVVQLESRPANIEGKGAVTIRDLVRNALRMRPDRIVVGEVRGGEALDMLQAMNTGHDGSLSTVHANTPRDALARLETMVLMAGIDLPMRAIREQVAAAVNVIVHLSRLRDGTRRVTQITEIQGMEGDTITMQDVYTFDYSTGIDDDGRFLGSLQPTGIRPTFAERLAEQGISLDAALFGAVDLSPAALGTQRRARR